MGNYKELIVWKEARDLAVHIYEITDSEYFKRDFSFRDQMRRASISIASNIAEGDESGFVKLGIRYLYNSKASLAELETQVDIAARINYISQAEETHINEILDCLSRKLRKLILHRSQG